MSPGAVPGYAVGTMAIPADVLEFLAAQSPFSALPDTALREAAQTIEIIYRRRGEVILDYGVVNDVLPLIRKGAVEVSDGDGRLVLRLEEGDSFGFNSLLTGDPTRFRYTLIEDSLIWRLPAARFHALRHEHVEFDRHFVRTLEERLTAAARPPNANTLFDTRLEQLASKPAIMADAGSSIRDVAQQMAQRRISSLLLGSPEHLEGIVTDRDLRNKVLACDLDPSGPVRTIMSPQPITLDARRTAFDALLCMLDARIHHLPVVEEGRVVGVVTSRDLLALQTEHPLYLVREIGLADDVADLQRVLSRLPELCARLLSAGADAAGLPRVLTVVNDAVTRRLLELARARLGTPPAPYAWLVFGSQARAEQSLYTDQDNALLLSDGHDRDTPWFRDLAEFVCAGLDRCGQRYCDGGIMAQNPRWRMDVDGWLNQFRAWIGTPEPKALLNASIFFDIRHLVGDGDLSRRLLAGVDAIEGERSLFLGILVRQALAHDVPLGTFRRFVVEADGAHRDQLDIKRCGLLPLVETVRAHALRARIHAAGTQERLDELVTARALPSADAAVLGDALRVFTRLRVEHQLRQIRGNEAADNWIAPDRLNEHERRDLRDAFVAVRNAQAALAAELGVDRP